MKMENLVHKIDDMTDDELREHLRRIRHNRSVERPAAKAKRDAAVKKESRKKMTAIDKLVAGLSQEEIEALLKQLGD